MKKTISHPANPPAHTLLASPRSLYQFQGTHAETNHIFHFMHNLSPLKCKLQQLFCFQLIMELDFQAPKHTRFKHLSSHFLSVITHTTITLERYKLVCITPFKSKLTLHATKITIFPIWVLIHLTSAYLQPIREKPLLQLMHKLSPVKCELSLQRR